MRIVIAGAGAVGTHLAKMLSVENENVVLLDESEEKKLVALLRQDPRPSYKSEDEKIYGMKLGGKEIKFKYENCKLIVTEIE